MRRRDVTEWIQIHISRWQTTALDKWPILKRQCCGPQKLQVQASNSTLHCSHSCVAATAAVLAVLRVWKQRRRRRARQDSNTTSILHSLCAPSQVSVSGAYYWKHQLLRKSISGGCIWRTSKLSIAAGLRLRSALTPARTLWARRLETSPQFYRSSQ